ncbi:MAG: VOC family protein [Pseudomonadota bacterium]
MSSSKAVLEHVNFTVSDPRKTADMLVDLFGWRIRWEGASALGGYSVHVGNDDDYIAVYAPPKGPKDKDTVRNRKAHLNHVGIVVQDLDAAEERVKKLGFEPFGHGNYEPGRRFYFLDDDGVEYELVSYAN